MILQLTELINKGSYRACYAHPNDKSKCIKVPLKSAKIIKNTIAEIKAYKKLKYILGKYLVWHDDKLVDTDKGKGAVCELLRDDDGNYSKNLLYYHQNKLIDIDILSQLRKFFTLVLQNNIFFFDFNYKNFVVLNHDGKKQLKYIDMKSYCNPHSWTFLKLERFIPCLAKSKMRRRIIRFYAQGQLNYPEYISAL